MAIHWNTVLGVAPELGCIAIDTQIAILAFVNAELESWPSGSRKDMASAYLAAHLATVSARGTVGAVGPVVSESMGGISRSFGAVAADASTWSQSPYGLLYASMIKTSIAHRMPGVA